MRSLPFSIENLNGGFMKIEGILRVEKQKLVFEFQKKDAVIEAYKSDVQSVEIPVKDLEAIELKKGMFSTNLVLHARTSSVFNDLPGKELTERILKIKKKYRDVAASISSNINLTLSEIRLNELSD